LDRGGEDRFRAGLARRVHAGEGHPLDLDHDQLPWCELLLGPPLVLEDDVKADLPTGLLGCPDRLQITLEVPKLARCRSLRRSQQQRDDRG
jgi:hypothetical protein